MDNKINAYQIFLLLKTPVNGRVIIFVSELTPEDMLTLTNALLTIWSWYTYFKEISYYVTLTVQQLQFS